ncbi:MAG TPA: hypothetical protein ENI76_07675 [Ignavibacteria bacterium]|nr:hypothetical protein [Ignavibacteria bacterium]
MSNIKLFQTQQVRTYWDDKDEKWFFSIVDVIEILTESVKPRDYWYRLKKRENKNGIELSTNCRQLKMKAKDAKGFVENKDAARIGEKIAGNARKELEEESGESIISSENYLPEKKTKNLKEKKK